MSKKKYTQDDLRRLMQEQKLKAIKGAGLTSNNSTTKIDSPLAKYENGKLTCILCKSVVRSENVWKVHINSKNHREKVAAAKELKEHLLNADTATNRNQKRSGTDDTIFIKPQVPEKKVKLENSSIEKLNNDIQTKSIPNDFFDTKTTYFTATLNKTSIKKDLVNFKRNPNEESKMEIEETEDDKLPEGFFDDPVKDAKVRNTEYKDPQVEEWERFQREIKEETTHSVEIIAGDHEVAIAERQIEEIDEQIHNWSRVLNMEKKTENILTIKNQLRLNGMEGCDKDESDDDDIDLDNLNDWRTKKLKLK